MKTIKFTSIRAKIIIGFLGLFIISVMLIFTLISDLYLMGFEDLETFTVEKKINGVDKEIEERVALLSNISQNLGIWDESYLFVKGLDENFVKRSLVDENFNMYDVNVIIFANESGRIVYGKQKGLKTEAVEEVDKELLDELKGLGIFENKNPDTELQGIIVFNEKPMLLATSPILKTDRSGPVAGNVVLGRFMDAGMMEEISDKFGFKTSFELVPVTKANINESIADKTIEIVPMNDQDIVGSIYLPEMLQQYFIKLNVEMPRDIMNIGKKSVNKLSILVTIIEVFIFTLSLYALNKLVLSRITNLNAQVIRIKEDQVISDRLNIDGNHDEITQLAVGVNDMLEGLEELHCELIERTNELQIINQRLEVEIVERQKIQEEVTFLAYHDHLTGLPNRILLTDRLNQGLILAKRHGMLMSLMFIDLDGFKVINDTLGHDQGDALLKQVAERLTKSVRGNDTVCRIGGDEFVLLISGYEDEKNLDTIASKIMDCLKKPFVLRGQEYYVTISMGIAQYPVDGKDVETLMKNADIVMYEAKNLGKNQYQKCSKDLKDLATENMLLTHSLHRAIERNEMMLYYQPQVNGLTGEIEGVEALLRWKHPQFGFISPTKFIPLAEKTRLILPIGNWVLRAACEQCKNWQLKGLKPIRMAVNFSIHQINKPDIVEDVKAILDEFSLQSSYLEIELTESIAMNNNDMVNDTLQQFKDSGITLSIDDFGTEYSSLSRLKDLPIDRVKIDISFIKGIGLSKKDEAITKAVILLAGNLGLKTIAEGVENREQLDFLNSRMCDEVQGFYMHKPMPADEMEILLREV